MAGDVTCPVCDRAVKVGLVCSNTVCPWELEVERGRVVVAELRPRIK